MIRIGHNDPSKYECWKLFRATLSETYGKRSEISSRESSCDLFVVSWTSDQTPHSNNVHRDFRLLGGVDKILFGKKVPESIFELFI